VTSPERLGAPPGLCGLCVHARSNTTRRGSTFLRCGRAATDERFAKYPTLPVFSCPGFEPR
jgi:hypothetical protein